MAFGLYAIYAADNVTPLTIPQPVRSSWARATIGTFLDGTPRLASRAAVTWQFDRMTQAQYEQLGAAFRGRGLCQFLTYRAGEVVPSAMVKCSGVMAPIVQGTETNGLYRGVALQFTDVAIV